MNHEYVSAVFFDERYVVPAEQTAPRLFERLPHGRAYAATLVDAMATAYLVAVLESLCLREVAPFLEPGEETMVGAHVDCRHCAPVAPGAEIRVAGWVERIDQRDVTFRVQAQDEHEQVCEAVIRVAVVPRERMRAVIARKRGALERRELFAPA
jgi:fluoroacetyl-CoA thioesterase